MTTYQIKLKHILPTFLYVALGTIFGVALVRWLFSIQFELLDVKLEIWELWIPLVFPWVPMTLWLRQKLRILIFTGDDDKGRFFFQIITWGTMTAALMVSQRYLTTATGGFQNLKNVLEIENAKKAKYYTLNEFDVVPNFGGSFTDFRTSGKYNEYLNFNTYFVCPIVNDSSRSFNGTPKYWYGVKFKEQISNRLGEDGKEKRYKEFYSRCVNKMNAYKYRSLEYFERLSNSEDRDGFLKAVNARTNQPTDDIVILQPHSEKFDSRNGDKLAWTFGSFGIGLSIFLFALIWPGYSTIELERHLAGKKPHGDDDMVEMLKYLVPGGKHYATSIILDLNILVFLFMIFSGVHVISPNGMELLEWGANRRFETTSGEYWRLFTSMFVHGGVMHLFLNVYGLVLAAMFVEPVLGRTKYLILYFVSGIMGSIASIWWYQNTISVGASGAIFGLYGAILGLLLTNAFPKDGRKGILTMIGIYVGINLLWGLTGGIDNAAHIGGLLSGALVGILLYKLDDEQAADS